MSELEDPRDAATPLPPEAPAPGPELPTTLVPRPLAAAVLVAVLGAGALSAWLVLTGDPAAAPTSEAPPASGPSAAPPRP